MSKTSKPLFVYLQRPDSGEWVTVGRYLLDGSSGKGLFKYAPSYVAAGLNWSIDPVNLPFIPEVDREAPRYRGLHDVLRDACPDSWGKLLLRKEHGLPEDTHDSRYLLLASNADRWGALAIGTQKSPSVSRIASPKLPQLETLAQELLAIFERKPPVDARLRRRLIATPSLGGARPKATVYDDKNYWLVKPLLPTDTADIPVLEHFAQSLGRASGLNFAQTVLHRLSDGVSVIRVLRFDRHGDSRTMALSAASLLQTEYPGGAADSSSSWSYPRLAEELKRIGTPLEDRKELFARMVLNAVVGNDDDHPRNHAVVYSAAERRWRLAPAFDVVPNPDETPKALTMQVSLGRRDISREAICADAHRFGFDSTDEATACLENILRRIEAAARELCPGLTDSLREMMAARMETNLVRLRGVRIGAS